MDETPTARASVRIPPWSAWSAVGLGLLLPGCQGDRTQSALHPAGPAAEAVARLWWVLLLVLGVYSLVVFVLTLIAIFHQPQAETLSQTSDSSKRPVRDGKTFILIGGVVLPALILVPLLVYSVSATAALRMRDSGLTIQVVGHRWWWEVIYQEQRIVTANELVIPVGEPVRLELTASDVIHSFWVPQLHGKTDMLPGQTTVSWLEASKPGIYRGQCAEYCGMQHAHMAFQVIALPPEEFVVWLNQHAAQTSTASMGRTAAAAPAASTATTANERAQSTPASAGQQAFLKHGCAVCHTIQRTPAVGRAGPDLTLIAGRKTLAAATLPNTRDNLLAWLIDPQAFKPGVKMPPTHAPVKEIEAIVDYLLSLDGGGESLEFTP